jgi:REP element-mobilizing transposase RayT
VEFQFFDPDAEVTITARRLPHWEQAGATYFITFRTADSLPESVLLGWRNERNGWLRRHKINPLSRNLDDLIKQLPIAAQREYHNAFTAKWHALLDVGHGACVLRQSALSACVAKSLRHFDGDRYQLGDFGVMPNHVHSLVMFPGVHQLKLQCRSWKKFTAGEINSHTGQKGEFWQSESFDHLVRSPEQFEYYRRYIAENPVKARLVAGEYHYYRCPA